MSSSSIAPISLRSSHTHTPSISLSLSQSFTVHHTLQTDPSDMLNVSPQFINLAKAVHTLVKSVRSVFDTKASKLLITPCILNVLLYLINLNMQGQPEQFDKNSPIWFTVPEGGFPLYFLSVSPLFFSAAIDHVYVDVFFLVKAFSVFSSKEITESFELV